MQEDPIRHGFRVNVIGGDGKPSIFIYSFFPDQIVKIEPVPPSGAAITVRYNEGEEPVALNVVPGVDAIKSLIERCRMLDEQDPPAGGALKDGRRIP